MKFTLIATRTSLLLNTENLQTVASADLVKGKIKKITVMEDFTIKFPQEFDLWIAFVKEVMETDKNQQDLVTEYNDRLDKI